MIFKNFVILSVTMLIFSTTFLSGVVPNTYALSVVAVTDNGSTFPIFFETSSNNTNTNSTISVGQAMINGMGLQSRIIQNENDGRITHGVEDEGQDDSIKPYLQVASTTEFAATILDEDTELTYLISEFWHEYDYDGVSLNDITTESPNILGYSQTRDLDGSNVVSINNGIKAVGNAKTVIALNDYADEPMILRGDAGIGIIKIITSSTDLMNEIYDTPKGYLTYSGGNPGTNGISVVAGIDSIHIGHFDTATWIPSDLHWHDFRGGGGSFWHEHGNFWSYGYDIISTLVKLDNGDHKQITGHTNTDDITAFRLYDTLPSIQEVEFTGIFEQSFTFPSDVAYLYVEPNGDEVIIKGESNVEDMPFIEINNLPINTPYQITKDGLTIR